MSACAGAYICSICYEYSQTSPSDHMWCVRSGQSLCDCRFANVIARQQIYKHSLSKWIYFSNTSRHYDFGIDLETNVGQCLLQKWILDGVMDINLVMDITLVMDVSVFLVTLCHPQAREQHLVELSCNPSSSHM